MSIGAGFRKFINLFSTAPDSAPNTASLVDAVDHDRFQVVLRGLEAGPGIQLDVVDSDLVPGTPWRRIRISASGGVVGGQREAETVVWSGGTVSSGTITLPSVLSAAAPDTVYAKDVDVFLNGLRLHFDKDKTLATGNQYDVQTYDVRISVDNLGYPVQNGDIFTVVFFWS